MSAAVSLLTDYRLPADIDITVHEHDFDRAAEIVGSIPTLELDAHDDANSTVLCGDGVLLDFPLKGLNFRFPDKIVEIDLVATGQATYGDHTYDLSLSKLAVDHSLLLPFGEGIYVANAFDIMAFKAVMQRGADQEKCDREDIMALADACSVDVEYAHRRAKEIGLTQREFNFLRDCGVDLRSSVLNFERDQRIMTSVTN